MKKIYHLSTCSTCQKIIKELNPDSSYELVDIKKENIDAETLDFLAKKVGSYEALFSKRAIKYKEQGLKDKNLQETDFRNLMLEEYTFLKRPFIISGDNIAIGNSKSEIEKAKTFI